MLSFPDRYLLRGILALVAISLMVPGIFGVGPPRWFAPVTVKMAEPKVPEGKIKQPKMSVARSIVASGSGMQDQIEPHKVADMMANGPRMYDQPAKTTVPVAASTDGSHLEKSNQGKPTPGPLVVASQFSANRMEQPAVKAREAQIAGQLASVSPKIPKIKPIQPSQKFLVPRVFAKRIPLDHLDLATAIQKENFIQITLPLILAANEEIDMRRAAIQRAANSGDRAALEKWAQLYRIESGQKSTQDIKENILLRADKIPVALALAQAAVESGWGTSRFALQGNALFGQWAWKESAGLKPLQASNDRAVVRSFPNLFGSVRAYMHNLNTHPSYADLRRQRARLANKDEQGKGYALAENLDRYAEIGIEYVDKLRAIIRVNQLDKYAMARLR